MNHQQVRENLSHSVFHNKKSSLVHQSLKVEKWKGFRCGAVGHQLGVSDSHGPILSQGQCLSQAGFPPSHQIAVSHPRGCALSYSGERERERKREQNISPRNLKKTLGPEPVSVT